MSLQGLVRPTCLNMLRALAGWLAKAEAEMPDQAPDLLSARLAPDMFPLATQVRFACVQALEAHCRVTGQPLPGAVAVLLDEGRNAVDKPGTLAQAQARISETIDWLEAFEARADELASDSPVAHELPNGMIFDLTALQYARDWALPQFYFHLMIAYAILRHRNVPLGKADYVAHMFAHLRPGTLPG